MSNKIHLTNDIAIRKYDSSVDSLEQITAMLHRSYAALLSRGFNYVAATQSSEVTESRLNDGIAYVVIKQGQVIATVTYYPAATENRPKPAHYKKATVAHFGQFAVEPELQKSGIGGMLMDLVENQAKDEGKGEIACDTAEGAHDLIAYYAKRDYRVVDIHKWPAANYRSVILSKQLQS